MATHPTKRRYHSIKHPKAGNNLNCLSNSFVSVWVCALVLLAKFYLLFDETKLQKFWYFHTGRTKFAQRPPWYLYPVTSVRPYWIFSQNTWRILELKATQSAIRRRPFLFLPHPIEKTPVWIKQLQLVSLSGMLLRFSWQTSVVFQEAFRVSPGQNTARTSLTARAEQSNI